MEKGGFACASDAFFPFRDNVDVLAAHGVTCIIQPGGSKRDDESIQACNEHGIAMVFTVSSALGLSQAPDLAPQTVACVHLVRGAVVSGGAVGTGELAMGCFIPLG